MSMREKISRASKLKALAAFKKQKIQKIRPAHSHMTDKWLHGEGRVDFGEEE